MVITYHPLTHHSPPQTQPGHFAFLSETLRFPPGAPPSLLCQYLATPLPLPCHSLPKMWHTHFTPPNTTPTSSVQCTPLHRSTHHKHNQDLNHHTPRWALPVALTWGDGGQWKLVCPAYHVDGLPQPSCWSARASLCKQRFPGS